MLRLRSKLLSFSIVSHKIAHNIKDYHRDPTLNFYPVVGLTDIKLGTISLNQPNNQNSLTVEMIDELFRFFKSYQHDNTVENVWIQNRGSMFLAGLSFHQMMANPDYIDKLYKMTAMAAKLNKPIFSYITGGVRNVGAYVLSMSSVALSDSSSSLRIDQVSKGFIPIAGGSHRLSRIPAKIGFYLALTGKKLSSNQMSRLGFITAIAKQGVSSKTMRTQLSKSNLFFRNKIHTAYNDQPDSQWTTWQKINLKKKNLEREIFINQKQIINKQDNVFSRFAMNQYRIAQLNYDNSHQPFNSFSKVPGWTINNYFMMRHEKALKTFELNGLIEKSQFQDIRLPGIPLDKVLKVFGQTNLHEAIKVLQSDTSDWAKQTLKALRAMDPLAAHLTYQLLQKAEELSWDQCLQLEYTIAKKLLSQSELVLKQTFSGSKYVFTNKYSTKRIEQIALEQVTKEFFNGPTNNDQKLQLDVPSYSLLPHSDYREIPDSARLTMNQVFFDDIHLGNQQKQMLRYLQQERIDYRHKSFDINLLREKIHQKKQVDKIQEIESKRLQLILNNKSVLNQFVNQRYDYIDKLDNKQFEGYLEKITKNVFNDGIKSRFEEFNKTAETIGKQKKLEIFKNLRKTLVKKIVINGVQTESQNLQHNETFQGPLFFDKNGGNVLEDRNPELQSIDALNKLALNLENRQLSEQFKQNQGVSGVDRHIGSPQGLTKRQAYVQRVNESIGKRYQQYPQEWQRSYEYKQLIKKASQTSEELAQYLEWGNDAFYTTILNSPAHQRTYNELGEQYLNRMNQERNMDKEVMKNQTEYSQKIASQFYQKLYSQKGHNHYKPKANIREHILPKKNIPAQLQKCFSSTLELVLKHFEEKYYQESLHQRKLQLGDFDKYIYENKDKQFVQIYKNDILFVYTYLTVLKMKDILHNLKLKGGVEKVEDLHNFFKQYHIEFSADQDIDSMNKIISKFLFQMLDIHNYTKAKIRLPQNKLLDFINRTKVFRETNKKSLYPLSFQSILLMISKDRTKLYNKVLQEYLPSQPQYLLQMSNMMAKDIATQSGKQQSIASNLYPFENAVSSPHIGKKSLVAGYQYYLGLFDSFIQRASGKYNFVNDEILALNPQQTRKSFREVLNISESSQEWIDRISNVLIKRFFNLRLNFEKTLTKGELLALDQELKEILNPETFKLLLKYQLQTEIQETKKLFRNVRNYSYSSNESEKTEQMYCEIRRNVKNPQAFKRLNNLKMAMQVQSDYIKQSENNIVTEQEQQDLVDEKRQFTKYERFPRETYKRIVRESFQYGEQKNFDEYLNNLGEKEMDLKQHMKRLVFEEDERKPQKQEEFSNFGEQIKSLKSIISNTNNQQIDNLYKKIESLL